MNANFDDFGRAAFFATAAAAAPAGFFHDFSLAAREEMEDYIFQADQAALNLAAKLDRGLAVSQDNIKLLSGMTEGISYVFLKY